MVLFISGRTDILTYYSNWLIKRIRAGYVDTRNPYNPNLVSRINFSNVDIVVFCTKNPHPFIKYLDEAQKLLNNVPFIFHVTMTPYNDDIEPIIGKIKKDVIEDIKYLSTRYGKDRIFVRYDPIFKSKRYTIDYHIKAFNKLVTSLNGYVGISLSTQAQLLRQGHQIPLHHQYQNSNSHAESAVLPSHKVLGIVCLYVLSIPCAL